MIKVPVTHNPQNLTISDVSGFNLAFFVDTKSGNELAKRINLHDDLINAVKELLNVIDVLVDEENCIGCCTDIVTGDFVIDAARTRAKKLFPEC